MAIGTIGTRDLIARTNPPFLNSCRRPSGLLVPSGKMTTDIPLLIRSAARSILLKALSRFERSIIICPEAQTAQPNTGIFTSSFLATHRSWTGIRVRARISKWLWWLDINIYGFRTSSFSIPLITIFTLVVCRSNHAQNLAGMKASFPEVSAKLRRMTNGPSRRVYNVAAVTIKTDRIISDP